MLYVALSLLQYETGHNASFDLALYARSLWGIAHGAPFPAASQGRGRR